MADLNPADVEQQYGHTVCFYKGHPHKVKRVGDKVKLLDIFTQRSKTVEFSLKDFSGPRTRLGFVNYDDSVVYVTRQPVRMMQVGITQNNCRFLTISEEYYPNGRHAAVEKVATMECPEFGEMLLGHYPPLKSAFKLAEENRGATAFDKQFAVGFDGAIYYKDQLVGTYDKKTNTISFKKGKEFLQLLLEKRYEKDARTFG